MKTFKDHLAQIDETPIGDYQTIGNWDKGASFRSKRDRTIIRHPRAIEITKKKFNNNHHTFNLYFVNKSNIRHAVELRAKDIDWVRKNLGDDVADAVEPQLGVEGNVNVVFTNNYGEQGKPMTAWIMAHRIAHAVGRYGGNGHRQYQSYTSAADTIVQSMSYIMDEYGRSDYPDSDRKMTGIGSWDNSEHARGNRRKNQLIMLRFFQSVCTFKSARDNNIRDWFEVLHELFAQYITTGKIKFNKAPKSFGSQGAFGKGTGVFHIRTSLETVDDTLNTLANTLEYYFDEILDNVADDVLIM